MSNAVRGRNAAKSAGDELESEWKEIEALLKKTGEAVRARDSWRLGVLAQRLVLLAVSTFTQPAKAPAAVTLRWRGWTFERIANELGITPEGAAEAVRGWAVTEHVQAIHSDATSPVYGWSIDRLDIEQRIVLALRRYAVVTIGHLVHIDRDALAAMEGLSPRDVRDVLKEIQAAADGRARSRRGLR